MIDNAGLGADGGLSVEICAATVCRSGRKLLAGSAKNTFLQIPLDGPLPAPGGATALNFYAPEWLTPDLASARAC